MNTIFITNSSFFPAIIIFMIISQINLFFSPGPNKLNLNVMSGKTKLNKIIYNNHYSVNSKIINAIVINMGIIMEYG